MRTSTLAILLLLLTCCQNEPTHQLVPVTVDDFAVFIKATNYTTDAERYGWSIIQLNVFDFDTRDGATWQLPDGKNSPTSGRHPVTQVSYNDALAYCKWKGTRLPSYDEFWELAAADERLVIYDNKYPISAVDTVNVVGNVWDITEPGSAQAQVRLAGGSLFCSENTCHGTQKSRELYVDRETGNLHIGFSVVEPITKE